MIGSSWTKLAPVAMLAAGSHASTPSTANVYSAQAFSGIKALQAWYNTSVGLWDSTGWWNSGNCLTMLADFAAVNPNDEAGLRIPEVIENTFTQAPHNTEVAEKSRNSNSLTTSRYHRLSASEQHATGFTGFINNYYDDEGWWALGLIRSYDVTGKTEYLDAAENIFKDMQNGTDDHCGGGIWWSKDRTYKNAIANELYLAVGASLANRVPAQKAYYTKIAQDQWTWFKNSGMINAQNTINDGLTSTCQNNGQNTWSYNQGVILGGLVELNQAAADPSLIDEAHTIATAAIGALSKNGILHDACEPNCGNDGPQFKGIFMRNLMYLQQASGEAAYKAYIQQNADAIWSDDRNINNDTLGVVWSGPASLGGAPSASKQSSALDALVAAAAVSM